MTPEERVNQEIWWVLQRIKEENLVAGDGNTFFYDTTSSLIAPGVPNRGRERKIIQNKLAQEEKAIKIIKEIEPSWTGGKNGFYLKVLQPKFDEVYKKYQKACDLQSYLNNYQQKVFKEEKKLPKFSQVENIDNKEKTTLASSIRKHKGRMFERGSGGGYYNRSHPIRPKEKLSANEIVDGFSSSNYRFVLTVIEKIASLAEFSLDRTVHYQLQSPPGQLLIQERMLLTKFESFGLFRNAGEDGIHGIATLRGVNTDTIRKIITEINKRQLALPTKSEDKSGDLKTRYDQLLEEIRKPKEPAQDLKKRYEKTIEEKVVSQRQNEPSEKLSTSSIPDKYKISVKDREIWVNNYLIGKPHAVGSNFEFLEYVRNQPPDTKIELTTIPNEAIRATVKETIQGRRFIKILNALGFKGEIKKAFFYKVGNDSLYYRGDEITKTDLEKAGVKIYLFLKELEVAHARIVPSSPI